MDAFGVWMVSLFVAFMAGGLVGMLGAFIAVANTRSREHEETARNYGAGNSPVLRIAGDERRGNT